MPATPSIKAGHAIKRALELYMNSPFATASKKATFPHRCPRPSQIGEQLAGLRISDNASRHSAMRQVKFQATRFTARCEPITVWMNSKGKGRGQGSP